MSSTLLDTPGQEPEYDSHAEAVEQTRPWWSYLPPEETDTEKQSD